MSANLRCMRSCFLAFVFAFTLCVLTAKPAEKKEILRAGPNESTKASTSAGAEKPQYGSWGFDRAGADLKTRPGDDFFGFANGAWLDRVKIPGDKPAYSLRIAMTDTTEQRLHDLMETVAKRDRIHRLSKAKLAPSTSPS